METSTTRVLTYGEAIAEALREEMERDERVVLIGSSRRAPQSGWRDAHRGLAEAMGAERVLELPMGALGSAGAAVGAAIAGLRPVIVWHDADAPLLALDVIVNQAAALRFLSGGTAAVPAVFRASFGGYRSAGARLSRCLEAWFAAAPGLKVVLPATARDARGLLKSAIRDDNPVLFLEHVQLAGSTGEVPADEDPIPLGVADVKRAGGDVSVITYSYMVEKSLEAAALLAAEGTEVEVLDLRSVLPLDEAAILESVARTGRLVIVQEAHAPCSVASEVAALVAEKGLYHLDAPVRRVSAGWAPIPFAAELEREVLPRTDQIVAAVREVLNGE
jgi:pyruvate/2-oxoglutarate/acetoin dehydrogenase E1 component